MRFFCWQHRALTLFTACPECLRERAVRSLAQRRAEVAALKEKAEARRQRRVTHDGK